MKTYRPIEFRHVCAIARALLLQSPSISDADWKFALKETCEKQGWEIPDGEMIARALGAVERALVETMGFRRPIEALAVEPRPRLAESTDRGWTSADYRALAETLKQIAARQAAIAHAPQNVTPIATTRLDIDEAAALDRFYIEAEIDRLGALKRFAEIAIVRPPEWDFAAVREAAKDVWLAKWTGCFGCRHDERQYHRHHVIQIQHGGSNALRNVVLLCDDCHAIVHPWLPRVPRIAGSWVQISHIGKTLPQFVEDLRRRNRSREAS